MPARHCCCCLPLRLGAFVISLFQLLGSGLIAAVLWIGIAQEGGQLAKNYKIAAIVAGVYYSLVALSSLIALIGTFVRSRRALAQYAYWLWWAVGVNIALDVWNLVTIFRTNKNDLVKDCVNGSTDQNVIDTCNKTVDSTWWRVVVIASMVLGLLIQCWAAYIVSSYAQKLEDEHSWKANVPLATGANYPGAGYKYEAAPGRASMEALTSAPNYAPTYPYADANHSFGANAAPYDPHQKV